VRTCEAACKALRIIFDKACPKEDSSRGRRAWNASAVIFTGKRTEAEGHLAVILQTLDVFRAKLMITNTKLLEDLKKAVDDFEKDEGGITHYGSGDIMSSGGGTFNLQKGDNTTFFANVGMNQRRDAIEQAYKNTFQWIFEEPREDKWNISRTWQWLTSSRKRPTNTIFTTWLRNETGIFWINGKPGAGKSTLMKFMVEDPRLAMHARVWAGSHKLSISSFYFWKHGSKLQKSLCGLYRAILFQMLVRDPQLALAAFPEWQTSFSSEDPLLETLRAALMRIAKADALRGTSRTKYLILIDGLDEFEDEGSDDIFLSQERFSADLRQISENDAVKIVVASRPERVYESNFSHGRHLAVHKLTAQDLKYFVHDSLINDKSTRPSGETYSTEEIELLNLLVRDIVEKSQGVSLWTRIVTNMIRVHMHKNRSLDLLQGLVEKLDTHLLNLFDQIMARILQLDEEKTEGLRYLALTFHWSSTVGSESAATGLMVLRIRFKSLSLASAVKWAVEQSHAHG
ncbi:hypothetical protein KC366_g15851, partial [Hortaea werneckii]